MRLIVRTKVPVESVKAWKGRHPEISHYDAVLDGNAEVYGPDGSLALKLVRGGLDPQIVKDSYPVFHWMKNFTSDNRSVYAGAVAIDRYKKADGTWSSSKSKKPIDKDGNVVKVPSAIAGYIEPQGGRYPFCRATSMTRDNPEQWNLMQTMLRDVAKVYKAAAPDHYAKQMEYVAKTDPAWVVEGSPFTTITVNNHVPAAYHQDAGDLKDAMGCMMVFKKGDYRGFELVIPEYRIAVRMEHGDVLLFDPTMWHGNIKPWDQTEDAERISVVMYYRRGIVGCESPQIELSKARKRGAL